MKRILQITLLSSLIMLVSFNGFTQTVEVKESPINLHLDKYEFQTNFEFNEFLFGRISTPFLYVNNLKLHPFVSPPQTLTLTPNYLFNSQKNIIFVTGIKINLFKNYKPKYHK